MDSVPTMQIILGIILIIASLGVILSKKPVYSCLHFLLALLVLAGLYLQLSAEFIAVMQVLIYAGAILVAFMFVMVLFQNAHQKIMLTHGKSTPLLIGAFGGCFVLALIYLGKQLSTSTSQGSNQLSDQFGTAQSIGKTLYVEYFFPFEAVILLFLIATIGSFYIGKKEV
ncbi:MAG: NADH-quinone oxidoreductase subunit J [Parachlamydiaceae bacterium]|nr:NADH-quinone oxidoreductase subunit J [Parachlamydiaceae bacterium]